MRQQQTRPVSDQHKDWLAQVDTEGPFLALPVVKDIWPHGVERLGDTDNRLVTFKQAFATWIRAYDAQSPETRDKCTEITHAWIDTVLAHVAEWEGLRLAADELPAHLEIRSPGEQVAVRAEGALRAREDGKLAALLRVVMPTESLYAPGLDGWAANEIDRMAMLLRKAEVEVGVVTDGRWWAIVWAADGKPTGSGTVDALTWVEEPLLRDAFLMLIGQRMFRAKETELRLPRLFERSELEAEEITEALGTQVRKSVELLVQAFSEARLRALEHGDPDPLTDRDDDAYQAAVTVMMRVVFLLFAEERGMLPTEKLYWDSYAIRDLLDGLKQRARDGEEQLDESYDAWHRLLAVSEALFAGVNYDEMRMPAYGGSLLDPERFPWLIATDEHGLRLRVSDRVMLHVLESVQVATVKGEARRISFREVDVEQIGYIYEGLLGYTCKTVEDDIVLGLVGKDGEEPEIEANTLDELYQDAPDAKAFASALLDWIKEHQPAAKGRTAAQYAKLYDADVDEADMVRLLTPVMGRDSESMDLLVSWGNYIRRDLRGVPLVVPIGGLVVVETPSRKNAGAHYTPRSLAEEVVLYALQPLVYEPGPLQTNDENQWRLKSSTAILDLKVADIAAGSGAFLVAAARFLSDRVTEAWMREGLVSDDERANPQRARDRAIREVIARCLYGADINPMAVEMCKLSLWLVSLDPTKPFSFVDDKIFCGNSLLGVTTLDQLKHMHIAPDTKRKYLQPYVDVDAVLQEATRLRKELASPVDEDDPQRSIDGKRRLLEQSERVTEKLRLIADGIIAAGLPLGGKPGTALDNAYKALEWALAEAFPRDGAGGDGRKLDAILENGLTPTVDTDYEGWVPLHWMLKGPDVVLERQGFDAVVGNPPFLGGQKLRGAMGAEMRDWFVNVLAEGRRGSADLVAYFFLRAMSLLNESGALGLIATNTVAQGDTREVALDAMVAEGFTITRAIQSRSWPAAGVNLEYAAVWGTRGSTGDAPRNCDDIPASRISTVLEPTGRVGGSPVRLNQNAGVAFQGCNILGLGFTLDPELAVEWIHEDPRNADVLAPYLNGEDLNSRHDLSASRWVVDFNNRSLDAAKGYALPFERVVRLVRPERAGNNDRRRREIWWQFTRNAPEMRKAKADLRDVIVVAQVSRTLMPVMVPAEQVLSMMLVVFATDELNDLALLSSAMHQVWAIKYGSAMRNDPRYTPSDVFETFPGPEATDRLTAAGKALNERRREIMARRQVGLTSLYNVVNDSDMHGDPDVESMREIHVEVNVSTMAAYGWHDVPLDQGFHTYRHMERWTVSPAARVEILDRLLEENHHRARAEGQDVPEQEEGLF